MYLLILSIHKVIIKNSKHFFINHFDTITIFSFLKYFMLPF